MTIYGSFGWTFEDLDVRRDGSFIATVEVEVSYRADSFRRGDYYTPDEPASAEITEHHITGQWFERGGPNEDGELEAAVAAAIEANHRELEQAALEDAGEREIAARERE